MNHRFGVLSLCAGVLFSASGAALAGEDAQLAKRLDFVLNQHASTGAVVCARVLKLPEREELYARKADMPCETASVYKLLTTAAALDVLGKDHVFKTYLAIDGDDLWIIGTGDPGVGDYRVAAARNETPLAVLENWVKALKERGITRIPGDLVYYDGEFETSPIVHPTWPRDWLVHWYAAPVTGLAFNGNCIDVTIFPTQEGQPVHFEVAPPVQGVQIINQCKTVRGKGSAEIIKHSGSNTYTISGTCDRKIELPSKPFDNPSLLFADAFSVQLAKAGIELGGTIRRAEKPLGGTMPPANDKIVAVNETKFTDVLSRINKQSQNLFAECLCKATGRGFDAKNDRRRPGSWKSGGDAIRDFLIRNKIDIAGLNPVDGTGLSPESRATATIITDVLAVMAARPDADVYLSSLPISGTDGSLGIRMRDLKGRVLGKTGRKTAVSSLAGYVKTLDGETLAFAFIFNNDIGATKLQDHACRILAHWPNVENAPSLLRGR